MSFCTTCGYSIKYTHSFCGKCGVRLKNSESKIQSLANSQNLDDESNFEKAVELFVKGKFEESSILLDDVLSHEPKHAKAMELKISSLLSFGIALRFSGGEELTQESLGFHLILFVSLALIFSSGINTSLYLIQQKGIFFKNSNDGSTINLGSDLRRVVNWALGPMQILFFIYTIISLTNYSIVIYLGITITICVCTSVISYYIIMQRDAWNSMFERFSSKIDDMILLEKKHTAILGSTSKDSKISKHPKFCPHCRSNTQIFYDKAYCPKCKNYL